MVTRRGFLKTSIAGTAVAATPALLPKDALAQAAPPHFVTDAAGVNVLNPAFQPKFVTPVPNAASAAFTYTNAGAPNIYVIGVEASTHATGLVAANGTTPLTTPIWGYAGYGNNAAAAVDGPTFPGRTIFARGESPGVPGTPIAVTWKNNLAPIDGTISSLLPIDTSLNIARVDKGVPIVVHQHGGNTPPQHDGGPDQWFSPTPASQADAPVFGPGCDTSGGFPGTVPGTCNMPSQYPMAQEGSSAIWYHDHALGITRTNVYAGTAGFWITRDANEDQLMAIPPGGRPVIPSGNYEVAYAIQDRLFKADGSLYYPSDPALYPVPVAPGPLPPTTHMPEFFGDTILVNGKAWPLQTVEPRPYRVRLLNGSDSRFYRLRLLPQATMTVITRLAALAVRFPAQAAAINALITAAVNATAVRFWQIGTELGILNNPVRMSSVTFGPGERLDLVIDFAPLTNQTLVFFNDAATPFPAGAPTPIGSGPDQIMAFRVNQPLNNAVPRAAALAATTNLRPLHGPLPTLAALQTAAAAKPVRKLILAEGADPIGRIMPLMGAFTTPTFAETILLDEEITETPAPGTTEIWEFYNVSVDSHPLHMHLVDFRILNREAFTANISAPGGKTHSNGVQGVTVDSVVLSGVVTQPAAYELGRKDTAMCPPGEVTRVLVNFPNRTGKYVYHCHILSHEDSEMMRFYEVVAPAPV